MLIFSSCGIKNQQNEQNLKVSEPDTVSQKTLFNTPDLILDDISFPQGVIVLFDEVNRRSSNEIYVKGWTIIKNMDVDSMFKKYFFVLDNGKYNMFKLNSKERKDVTVAQGKGKYNYDNAGFFGLIKTPLLVKGKRVGICLYDTELDEYYGLFTTYILE